MKNYKNYVLTYLKEEYGLTEKQIDKLTYQFPIGRLNDNHNNYKGCYIESSHEKGLAFYNLKEGGLLFFNDITASFEKINTIHIIKHHLYFSQDPNKLKQKCNMIFTSGLDTFQGNSIFDIIEDQVKKLPSDFNKLSFGEKILYVIFTTKDLPFSKSFDYEIEYKITDLKGYHYWIETPRFDGILKDKKTKKIIAFLEYDGKQHEEAYNENAINKFKQQAQRDACKNGWAMRQGVSLIRIPSGIKTAEDMFNYLVAWYRGFLKNTI